MHDYLDRNEDLIELDAFISDCLRVRSEPCSQMNKDAYVWFIKGGVEYRASSSVFVLPTHKAMYLPFAIQGGFIVLNYEKAYWDD